MREIVIEMKNLGFSREVAMEIATRLRPMFYQEYMNFLKENEKTMTEHKALLKLIELIKRYNSLKKGLIK